MNRKKVLFKFTYILFFALMFMTFFAVTAIAAPAIPNVQLNLGTAENPAQVSSAVQVIFLLTILSLAPSILLMMTAFTRIIMVLSFTRNAIGVQQMPPNQVLVGLALFLTFFVMGPIFTEINQTAYQPFIENKITQNQAMDNAMKPLRNFMLKQTYDKDLKLFISLSKQETPKNVDEIKNTVVIPAFITSELKRAFQIGFFIFIPFLMIDMIVASVLMTMGMMMLPPMMISLPFKVLLFVMVDGWGLIIKTLIVGFN